MTSDVGSSGSIWAPSSRAARSSRPAVLPLRRIAGSAPGSLDSPGADPTPALCEICSATTDRHAIQLEAEAVTLRRPMGQIDHWPRRWWTVCSGCTPAIIGDGAEDAAELVVLMFRGRHDPSDRLDTAETLLRAALLAAFSTLRGALTGRRRRAIGAGGPRG